MPALMPCDRGLGKGGAEQMDRAWSGALGYDRRPPGSRKPTMSASAAQPFDFRDPAFLADPYPVFRQLRATAPVWKAPLGRWFLTGYDDTVQLMRDRRFGRGYDDPEALIRR